MAAGRPDFTKSPVSILAVRGYTPFTVDAGIYAGGYQGIIYPNPTTIVDANGDFDPYQFISVSMSEYDIKNTGDIYEGLGKGNPSISYFNPGHIFGLMDTFNRMSYGLNIIKAVRDAEEQTNDEPGPIVPIELSFVTIALLNESRKIIKDEDLYPAFTEKPDGYIKNFVDGDGKLKLDPRTDAGFNFNDPYKPDVEKADAEKLTEIFGTLNVSSYFEVMFLNWFSSISRLVFSFNFIS